MYWFGFNYTFEGANEPWLNTVVSTGQRVIVGPGNYGTLQEVGWLGQQGHTTIGGTTLAASPTSGTAILYAPWP